MKKLLKSVTVLYMVLIGVLALIPFWPPRLWWLANLLQLLPLGLVLIPLFMLVIPTLALRLWKTLLLQLLGLFITIFFIMGYVVNFPAGADNDQSGERLRVLSMNIGKDKDIGIHFNADKFVKLIAEINPDIIALQESGDATLFHKIKQALPNELWYGASDNGLSLMSKMPIEPQELDNKGLSGTVRKFRLRAKDQLITFFNIHLMTPRYGIEAVITNGFDGINYLKQVTVEQSRQVQEVIAAIKQNSNVIIAGDFNMTTLHPLFHKSWSKFTDAFSNRGKGMGATKYLLFHGVRIDHILSDANWQVISARVGPPLDSDHRPTIVDLKFVGKPNIPPAPPVAETSAPTPDYSNSYHYENFEITRGSFDSYGSGDLFVDFESRDQRGNSLRIKMPDSAGSVKAGIKFDNWNFEKYSVIGFSYRIPEKTPVCVKVQTEFGDWLCLAGTIESQCTGAKPMNFVHLFDDNQWHQVTIDTRELVKSLLPALKTLAEVQFTIDRSSQEYNYFWIDDFVIK
jgi:vancomycin resistance protein VanJ